jgi:hypothetical protein
MQNATATAAMFLPSFNIQSVHLKKNQEKSAEVEDLCFMGYS